MVNFDMRGDLKHYDLYLKRINLFLKSLGVKVKKNGEYKYVISKRTVTVETGEDETTHIASFLHEAGHMLDHMINESFNNTTISKAYGRIYTTKYSTSDLSVVLIVEKRAWNYGRILAKNLGIGLGKWYDKEEKEALASYRRLS